MTSVYELFETSESAVTDGIWCAIEHQGQEICRIRVRSADRDLNPEIRKFMATEAAKSVKERGSLENVMDMLADPQMEHRLFAHAIVSDWEGITDQAGKALKCTPKNVEKVLNDLPLLARQIKAKAYSWTNFRKVFEQEAVGN